MKQGDWKEDKKMINSHIIPNFYLKQFAIKKPNGKHYVWVYAKGKKPVQQSTKNTAYENGYFAYTLPDGTVEESLEGVLKTMEEDAIDPLVSAKSDLFVQSESSRIKLASYAALLYARTTQRLDWTKRNWLELYQQLDEIMKEYEFAAALIDHFNRKLGGDKSVDWIRGHMKELIQQKATTVEAKNNFLEELIGNVEMARDALLQRRMRILKAPSGRQFVTSDNPLITFMPLPHGEFLPGEGFGKPTTMMVFPIAPNACVFFGGDDSAARHDVDAKMVKKINWIVIASAHHFVFSQTEDAEIQKMAQQLIGTYIFGKTAFIPRGPLPTARDFLVKFLGLQVKKTVTADRG
jgi:hypothetical protein